MNESEQDRTANTAVSKSQWKSAAVVVLILASIAMPCSTVLQLKGRSSMFRIRLCCMGCGPRSHYGLLLMPQTFFEPWGYELMMLWLRGLWRYLD